MDVLDGGVLMGEQVTRYNRTSRPASSQQQVDNDNKKQLSPDAEKNIQIRKKAADTAKKLISRSMSSSRFSMSSSLSSLSKISCAEEDCYVPGEDEDVSSNISSDGGSGESGDGKKANKDSGFQSSRASSSKDDTSMIKLSRNAVQIEALLKRINEENRKTKQVLESIQKSEAMEEALEVAKPVANAKKSTFKTAVMSAMDRKERTTSTFLDAYNNNNNNAICNSKTEEAPNNNNNNADSTPPEPPMVTWETSGEGKKIPIVIFNCQALSKPQPQAVGQKYHLTFKTVNADAKLISQICHAHGFHEVHASNTDYNLMWTGVHPKPHAFKSMLPHQRVNHFPRSYELTRKDRLYQNIERLQHSKGSKHFNFVPKTFMIPAEYSEFAATHHRMRGAWIVKPVASSRGRGIFIVSHPSQVPLDEPMVVAKYIDNPLLVNGHKWDLRLYVVVTSYDPLVVYLYEEGLVRFATVRYDSSGKNLWNPCMHLCNYSINKYHSDYIKCDDPDQEDQGHKWSLSALLRHLKANNIDTVQLMQNIEDVIIKSIISVEFPVNSACKMFVPHRRNCFELYGFDILVDSDLKPWLLEVNLSPSLNCDAPIDMKIKSAMICDLLNLVGLPATDPVLRRAQFNQKVINMTQQDEATRARLSKRSVSMETRRFAAIRLAATSTSLSQELSKMIKNAKEENARRGGYVRIFPTCDTWALYGSILEFSSPNNQILHEHLFPEVMKKNGTTRLRRFSIKPALYDAAR